MANYTVRPCVSDFIVCKDGKGIPELIVNSRRNALLIAAILEKDQKCSLDYPDYGFSKRDFCEVVGTSIDTDVEVTYSNPLARREWYKVHSLLDHKRGGNRKRELCRKLSVGDIIRHFKGNLYMVVSCDAVNSETNEFEVVYRALFPNYYGIHQTYVKPLSVFMEKVDKTKYPDAEQEYYMEIVGFEDVRRGVNKR